MWQKVNLVYALVLLLGAIIWVLQWHTFGISVGLVALVLAFFIYQRNRWAYFVAAVWCFGLLRIAMDDGHDFHQGYQSMVKLIYLVGVIIALVLHEKVAIKSSVKDVDNIPE